MKIAQKSAQSVVLMCNYKLLSSWKTLQDVLWSPGGLHRQVGDGQEHDQQGHPEHQECSYDLELTQKHHCFRNLHLKVS